MSTKLLFTLRITTILPISVACLFLYDIFSEHKDAQIVIVDQKEISPSQEKRYFLHASGSKQFREEVSKPFFDESIIGDSVVVEITPVFKVWGIAAIVRQDQIVRAEQPNNISVFLVLSIVFLLPIAVFFYRDSWRFMLKVYVWVSYTMTALLGMVLWVLILTGYFSK
jgi:hypothetical protein